MRLCATEDVGAASIEFYVNLQMDTLLAVSAMRSMTIDDLMTQVRHHFALMLGDTELTGSRRLDDCDIKNGSVLDLAVALEVIAIYSTCFASHAQRFYSDAAGCFDYTAPQESSRSGSWR